MRDPHLYFGVPIAFVAPAAKERPEPRVLSCSGLLLSQNCERRFQGVPIAFAGTREPKKFGSSCPDPTGVVFSAQTGGIEAFLRRFTVAIARRSRSQTLSNTCLWPSGCLEPTGALTTASCDFPSNGFAVTRTASEDVSGVRIPCDRGRRRFGSSCLDPPPGSSAQTAGVETFLRRLAPEEQARPEEPRVMLSAEPFGTGIF